MLKTQEQIINDYTKKINDANKQIDSIKKLIGELSLIRIGLFFTEVLLFVLLLNSADDIWRVLIQLSMVIPVAGFVFIVRKQSKLDKKLAFKNKLLWIYQNELNVLTGSENGYEHGERFKCESHPYTSDLDIFGNSSLFALVNRCSTNNGHDALASSLANINTVEGILSRQEAIKEMASAINETFEFRANLLGQDVDKIELIKAQLNNKLRTQVAFTRNSFLRFYVSLVPFLSTFLLIGGIFFGGVFWKFFGFFFFAHIAWSSRFSGKINLVFYSFSGGSNLLNNYSKAIRWTENRQWKSTCILNLFNSDLAVSEQIKKLSKIIQSFDSRLNLMIGSILNALLLWDFKCCINLDKWLESSSENVISSLNNLGDFEELISLATLAHNQPAWGFPEVVESFSLTCKEIAHPLIWSEKRIANNFNLENQVTVDIVTGSNMAGKSTFLRTVGINMVLAYAGAPVCAKEIELSVFAINTYMRIKDSLNEGTSTFKAELNRLKMILNNVKQSENTFVLIDEMLRGTNSRDKYLGSKVFIEKLLELKRPAIFATHDLQLADMQQMNQNTVRNFHFDISINNGEMVFDYKLKKGPCTTFNAAILLKEIGLALD